MYYNERQAKAYENKIRDFIVDCLSDDEKKAYDAECKRMDGLTRRFDISLILPKGCKRLGWEGSTMIEINYIVQFDTPQTILRKFKARYHKIDKHTLILIYGPNPYVYFRKRTDIELISFQELYKLTNTRKRFDGPKPPQIISLKEKKELCNKAFNEGNCTLFVGAGVSISANLPGWELLLYKTLGEAYTERPIRRKDKTFFKCASNGSYMVMARYLRIMLGSRNIFLTDAIKNALYMDVLNTKSDLINSIVNIVDTKKVNKIITYNYDDVLEKAIYENCELKPKIYSGTEIKKCDTKHIPIYHVHGIIPKYFNKYGDSDYIVLTEDSYHHLYNNQYKWSNDVQLKALKNNTCIFIGMSMSDPNLRRLLEATRSSERKCKHFAFLAEDNFHYSQSSILQKDIVDEMFSELGVHIIWYNGQDKHKKLLELLNSLINKQTTKY